MARGFCTCKRDFPQREDFHPPENATWHFLCDKPVLPAGLSSDGSFRYPVNREPDRRSRIVPTGTGWPVKS